MHTTKQWDHKGYQLDQNSYQNTYINKFVICLFKCFLTHYIDLAVGLTTSAISRY